MYELIAILSGSAASALILASEHFLLWSQKDQMSLTGRYIIGTATLAFGECLGMVLLDFWGVLNRTTTLGAVLGPVCAGGAVILSLHEWRRLRGETPWPETPIEAAFAAGIAKERSRNGQTGER